ncbi:MAG: hypothetical protein EBY35_02155 [Rhodobacteraceae bacterium]|nr:hypothetical protein [Paracoccaceae bacterium]
MSVPEMSKHYILRGWISFGSLFSITKVDKVMKFRLFFGKIQNGLIRNSVGHQLWRPRRNSFFCVILQRVL